MGVREERKQKRQIRVSILDLQDKYCKGCKKPPGYGDGSADTRWCGQNCDIGKQIFSLGEQLSVNTGYKQEIEVDRVYIKHTLEEWDEICARAIELVNEGNGYEKASRMLEMPSWEVLKYQLKKRGLYPRESANESESINTPEQPTEPHTTESEQPNDVSKGGESEMVEQKKKRTAAEWDEICKKAIELREAGKSSKVMYEELGVQANNLYAQLEKRGLQLPKIERKAFVKPPGVNVSLKPVEPLKIESEQSDDVLEEFKKQLQSELDTLQKENQELRKQLDECVLKINGEYVPCVRIEEYKLKELHEENKRLTDLLEQSQASVNQYNDDYTTIKLDHAYMELQRDELRQEVTRLEEAVKDTQRKLHQKESMVENVTRLYQNLEVKYEKTAGLLVMMMQDDIA